MLTSPSLELCWVSQSIREHSRYYFAPPPVSLGKSNRDEVLKMTVQQVASSAVDGQFRDGTDVRTLFWNSDKTLRVCCAVSKPQLALHVTEKAGPRQTIGQILPIRRMAVELH